MTKYDVESMNPSLAKGVAKRITREMLERMSAPVPDHLLKKTKSAIHMVKKGVPPKKRQKVRDMVAEAYLKNHSLLGCWEDDDAGLAQIIHINAIKECGTMVVDGVVLNFKDKMTGSFGKHYFRLASTHVFERIILRENIKDHQELNLLKEIILDAAYITGSDRNGALYQNLAVGTNLSVDVHDGGMILGEVGTNGYYNFFQAKTYINARDVKEHNYDRGVVIE